MKAIEILSESKKIEEGPAGIIGQAAKRIGAGLLGAAGLKTWAGQLNDKADVGTFANRYSREFDSFLKSSGKDFSTATFGDLKDFMTKNKIPSHNVPNNPNGVVDKDMVNSILTRTAGDFLGGKVPGSEPASAKKPAAGATAPAQGAPAQQSAPASAAPTQSAPASQPFNVPALLQVIPQMNKKDLNKILTATQTALQNPKLASKKAAAGPAPTTTANMTPAQVRATKQAAAANVARAQMKANPVAKPAPAKTPAQVRAEKQATAAQNAQSQMAPFSKTTPAPAVWKNNRKPNASATTSPVTKQAPGATTTTPDGEKVIANPVATIGNRRATNIGQKTFDTETGRSLPGQALNNIRKKAEYGTGALGKARKNIQAKKSVAV